MITKTRLTLLIVCLLLIAVPLTGCTKKELKKGAVAIKDYKFVLRQDSAHLFAADAVGTVRNVGDCAVKNIIITGGCHSCQDKLIEGKWFTSNLPPTKDEEGIIKYLAKGAKAEFRVKDIAMMLHKSDMATADLPTKMDIKILSFETVQ